MNRIVSLILLILATLSVWAQVPTDSVGIFAVHGDRYIRMDRITHTAIKGSGGLASVATFGVAKTKAKLQFSGATSPNQFDGTAKFRMYFGMPPTESIVNLYMFTANYSVKDFGIARFDVKKNARLLTGVSSSILGSSVGVASADDIKIGVTELRAGVYDIIVSGKPGEYCFMLTANGTGGFGGVFDFTIR